VPTTHNELGFAHNDPANPHKRGQQGGNRSRESRAFHSIARAGVHVSERNRASKPRANRDQGLAHVAQDQVLRVRYAVRMGRDLPVEDEDLSAWEGLAQMVVCPSVAEAEFKDRTRQIGHKLNGAIEAIALCLKPANEAVQPAHG
jgi:hypothetical protein